MTDFFGKSLERFKADATKAKDLATKPLGEAPAGSDLAELAAWTLVGNAPNGTPTAPTSRYDLGASIRVAMATALGADHFPFLELQATLIPSPDGTLAPTLISTEVQFTCAPPEEISCRMGSDCVIASDP